MGLHRDGDEETFAAPVVSLSLGDSAVFRIGGAERRDPTTSLRLHSGDVVVLAGPSRLAHPGIDPVPGRPRHPPDTPGRGRGGALTSPLPRRPPPPQRNTTTSSTPHVPLPFWPRHSAPPTHAGLPHR